MMDEHKQHFQRSFTPGPLKGTKNEYTGQYRFQRLLNGIETLKSLPVFSGLCEAMFGIAVAVVAILGFIPSFWLSLFLGVTGGIIAMTGIYLCYSVIMEHTKDTLLQEAMRRITEHQN
jgi:hypothetical protein